MSQTTERQNTAEATAKLTAAPCEDLLGWAWDSHKDFYGVKGRHMANYTHAELLKWILDHFAWEEDIQVWGATKPWCD